MMRETSTQAPCERSVHLLSRLLLEPKDKSLGVSSYDHLELKEELQRLSRKEFDDLLALARSHHVVVRGLGIIADLLSADDASVCRAWVESALAEEGKRIETAITFLGEICRTFSQCSLEIAVIKSLDHWPDIGSDLDLFTTARPDQVLGIMSGSFGADVAPRSWGDRLAGKWNFVIQGLDEAVEIHVGRLGQTGEHVGFPGALLRNARWSRIGERRFVTPSITDRILIATLQRMYRHFYFRLCDIVDTLALADMGSIDYDELRLSAASAGIWEGVAAYLAIVSDYAESYRGYGIDLPDAVLASASVRGSEVRYRKGFLRVPILPKGARLYGWQLAKTVSKGKIDSSARLTLLPWLATAALVGERITGSDKGIW